MFSMSFYMCFPNPCVRITFDYLGIPARSSPRAEFAELVFLLYTRWKRFGRVLHVKRDSVGIISLRSVFPNGIESVLQVDAFPCDDKIILEDDIHSNELFVVPRE